MAEQQNGYLTATQLLTNAINEGVNQGVTVDETLAALKVQCEVTSIRLAQVMVANQQMAAMQAQAAQAGQQELPLEGENNAN